MDDDVLSLVAECFETLSDATRLKVLYALIEGPLCVGDLAVVAGVSQSAMSHQLKLLKTRGLVKPRRAGNTIYYSLDDHHVAQLFREAEFHVDHRRHGRPDHHE